MNAISTQAALKLIRYNTDPEVAVILQAAIDELDRLERLEKHAIDLARAALETPSAVDRQAAWEVIKLSNTQIAAAPGEGEWIKLGMTRRGVIR